MKVILLISAILVCSATSCKISSQKTYTTTDASVLTSIAYITEFSAQNCAGSATENLYASVNNQLFQLAKTKSNTYLLSWTSEVAQATRGDHPVKIYNEDGNAAIRKGKEANPIGELVLNHPGAYSGPWLSSEHLAAICGAIVGYVAISNRSKLVA